MENPQSESPQDSNTQPRRKRSNDNVSPGGKNSYLLVQHSNEKYLDDKIPKVTNFNQKPLNKNSKIKTTKNQPKVGMIQVFTHRKERGNSLH